MEELGDILKKTDAATSKASTPTTSSTEEVQSSKFKVQRTTDEGPRTTCPICKGAGYLRRDVPPDHPDFGRLLPCQCKVKEIAEARLADLKQASNVGLLARMTFETFVPEGYGLNPEKRKNLEGAYQRALDFARHPQGWLIFLGGYGCGKTHLAAAIANDRLARGQPALFVVVPDLLDHLRAAFSPTSPVPYDERFEAVRTAPLLILDDLGTQSTTPWAQEKLYQIFNYRYNAELPTVITTNRSLEEIDLRLRSRMADPSLCTIYTILAPDFRQSGVDRGSSELSSLHLLRDQTFERFDLRTYELDPEERDNLKRAYTIAREYAETPEGWLVLTGDYGCGKTHLAAAIANHRVAGGYPALFIVVPDLLDHLRATFSPSSPVSYDKRFEEIRRSPFLVLDDLGTQSATLWAQEKLYQIFNYRYNARLPTVITMKQTVDEVDPRIRSRMLDLARCTVFAIIAPSYRGGGVKRTRSGQRGKKGEGRRTRR
jgi:DNA replication protein DnaC